MAIVSGIVQKRLTEFLLFVCAKICELNILIGLFLFFFIPSVNQIDKKSIFKSAPEEFQKMLTSLGVEKALDSIIQAVTT